MEDINKKEEIKTPEIEEKAENQENPKVEAEVQNTSTVNLENKIAMLEKKLEKKNKKNQNEELTFIMNNDSKFLYMMITLGVIIMGLICTIIILFKIQMDSNKLCYSPAKYNQTYPYLPMPLPPLPPLDAKDVSKEKEHKEISLNKELEKVEKADNKGVVVIEVPTKK